jgi:predicted transcriptional regulator
MMGFLKQRSGAAGAASPQLLGPLEISVMEILWNFGESNVHDVSEKLDRKLAYTTVMTTLDRLYKKGLLTRRKSERAFHYATRHTRREWDEKRAGEFLADFLTGPRPDGELLISCLVEAVGRRDAALLDELERKIRLKRKELDQRGQE